jgi:hypothetical protein
LNAKEGVMREIEIGIRIDQHRGLHFFGAEELNELILQGARVTAIEPGGAIMQKLGEEEGSVRLTLSGFSLKARVEET